MKCMLDAKRVKQLNCCTNILLQYIHFHMLLIFKVRVGKQVWNNLHADDGVTERFMCYERKPNMSGSTQ